MPMQAKKSNHASVRISMLCGGQVSTHRCYLAASSVYVCFAAVVAARHELIRSLLPASSSL